MKGIKKLFKATYCDINHELSVPGRFQILNKNKILNKNITKLMNAFEILHYFGLAKHLERLITEGNTESNVSYGRSGKQYEKNVMEWMGSHS